MILPLNRQDWPPEWHELWAERVGIMQFEGGMLQSRAEREAESDIRKVAERQK
jgi:hypothetical protein